MKDLGHKTWLIADMYYPAKSTDSKSHDAICVVNVSGADAHIKITAMFPDKAPMVFNATCPNMRTNHIRMDEIANSDGDRIPTNTPYSAMVESDTDIVVQYSRLDTSCGGMALMTTIAYPVK